MPNLTEKELNDLIGQMETIVPDSGLGIEPAFESAWLTAEVETTSRLIKQTLLAFRYHRAMNHHDEMKKAKEAADELKKSLDYCKSRLAELGTP